MSARLLLSFLGGKSMRELGAEHDMSRAMVEAELRWWFQFRPMARPKRVPKLKDPRSSRRWPFKLERMQRFVDLVARHEPITSEGQARRFGCSRRAAAMACAHLEDLGALTWSWQIEKRRDTGGTRRKLWRLA